MAKRREMQVVQWSYSVASIPRSATSGKQRPIDPQNWNVAAMLHDVTLVEPTPNKKMAQQT